MTSMSNEIFVNGIRLRNQADRFVSEQKIAEELEANIELAKVLASAESYHSYSELADKASRLEILFRELADNLYQNRKLHII